MRMIPAAVIPALSHLRSKGVAIDKTEDCDYGKFAWVLDADGNKIELFEEPPEQI